MSAKGFWSCFKSLAIQAPEKSTERHVQTISQKAQENVQTQEYYSNKHLNQPHPRAQVPQAIKEENTKQVTLRSRKNGQTSRVCISMSPERQQNLH